MAKYTIKHHYEEGMAYFRIFYKNQIFMGTAYCHPDDADMMSERTGLTIAEARAQIKLKKFQKKFEIEPVVATLHHMLTNIRTSNQHDEQNYESRMIRRQLAFWQNKLDEITADIKDEEKYLKEYIDKKEKLYQKLRAKNK
jgi:hypothetical protein